MYFLIDVGAAGGCEYELQHAIPHRTDDMLSLSDPVLL